MGYLKFTERMAGGYSPYLGDSLPTTTNGFRKIIESSQLLDFEFTVQVNVKNVSAFVSSPLAIAELSGDLTLEDHKIPIESGIFNLFNKAQNSDEINVESEMTYNFSFLNRTGEKNYFYGFKLLEKEDLLDAWSETTTLYFYLSKNPPELAPPLKPNFEKAQVFAVGILKISVADFIKQLTTFEVEDSTSLLESEDFKLFSQFFSKNIWAIYAPFVFSPSQAKWNEHAYPVNTTLGVPFGNKELYPIDTKDNLTISLQRFWTKPTNRVVLLVHGLTLSTDMYMMPEIPNLISYLLQHQFSDVWSLDWRGSNRFYYNLEPHRHTVDDIARFDIPAALKFIREKKGDNVEIHVICHCVGSLGFMSSFAANDVQGIKSIVANSVSYNPTVRWPALVKLFAGPFVFETILGYPYISPRMPYLPGIRFGKWIYWFSRLTRFECRDPACHMLSFMWGWGYPVAFSHKNMSLVTHRRLADLFGGTGFNYYRHMRKMITKGRMVSYKKVPEDRDYFELVKKKTETPILLMAGDQNKVFPGSNKKTFALLKRFLPLLEFFEVKGYGHQDVFMGKNSHLDVFPKILNFLNTNSSSE